MHGSWFAQRFPVTSSKNASSGLLLEAIDVGRSRSRFLIVIALCERGNHLQSLEFINRRKEVTGWNICNGNYHGLLGLTLVTVTTFWEIVTIPSECRYSHTVNRGFRVHFGGGVYAVKFCCNLMDRWKCLRDCFSPSKHLTNTGNYKPFPYKWTCISYKTKAVSQVCSTLYLYLVATNPW